MKFYFALFLFLVLFALENHNPLRNQDGWHSLFTKMPLLFTGNHQRFIYTHLYCHAMMKMMSLNARFHYNYFEYLIFLLLHYITSSSSSRIFIYFISRDSFVYPIFNVTTVHTFFVRLHIKTLYAPHA